jgi:predicted ArsR family transcriptional regulator
VKFATSTAPGTEVVPATRDRLVGLLLEQGPATAHVLAERLRLTPAAVRRHLDALVESGMVDASDRPPYGPVGQPRRGRPAKVFSLTEAGRAQFRQSYDTLATAALRHLEAELGPEAVAEFARTRVEALVGPHRDTVLSTAPEDRAKALAKVLSEDGFAASVEPAPHGGGDQLCQHHCPVAHVAAEFPQLCEAETAVFAELLGTHVQRLATIGHGDHVCTTYVPHLDEGTRR